MQNEDFNNLYDNLPRELFPESMRDHIYKALLLQRAGTITEAGFIGYSMFLLEPQDDIIQDNPQDPF